MSKKHRPGDRTFDGLSVRFQNNIYNTLKGQLRLQIIARDLAEFIEGDKLAVLDMGAGFGHWALGMARAGHSVTLNDASSEMLAGAERLIQHEPQQVQQAIRLVQAPLQQLPGLESSRFDLVACHAVMEWLEDPLVLLDVAAKMLKPGGYLSLVFYNVHGLVFKNLLRTNYRKVLHKDYRGYRGSLTPSNPLDPTDVTIWLQEAGFAVLCNSGIRVFHDYILDRQQREQRIEQLIEMELLLSRSPPYRDLGRYVHMLCRRVD